MADNSRTQKIKLANSRRKVIIVFKKIIPNNIHFIHTFIIFQFKELQELKKKRSVPVISSNEIPEESLTSSTHSSVNGNFDETIPTINSTDTDNQLPNYFTDTSHYESVQKPVTFFDNFTQGGAENTTSDQELNNYNYLNSSSPQTTFLQNMVSDVTQTPTVEVPYGANNYSLFSQENQPSFLAETQQVIYPNHDSLSIDDPEIKQNEILEIHRQAENNMSVHNRQELIHYLQGDTVTETQQNPVTDEPVQLNTHIEENKFSSIESLKQLSNQLADAIEPEYAHFSSSITDLEKRNLELAALFEQEKLKSEQQKVIINELQSKLLLIDNERKTQKDHSHIQLSNEISKLNEELQCHIQTVGLLVAEKTELSATLSQLEITCKQKNSECEEFQARLKASRSRVADLERELNMFKAEKSKIENIEISQAAIFSKMKRDYDELKEQKEELVQDLLETREKFKNCLEDNLTLQRQLQETASKLSLAELKIQQITMGNY